MLCIFPTLRASSIIAFRRPLSWAIFSCTSLLLIIPYIVNFEAYFKLKKTDKETPRPYVFPGPKWLSTLLIRIAEIIAIGTCVLFVWTPGVPVNMTQLVFVVIGTVVVLGLGVILMKKAEKEHMAQAE